MIDALFGSKTRVKLLHLFLNNPGQAFYVREITRLIGEQINSVRRELANMLEVGIITSSNKDNKLYYEVNQRYDYYVPMRVIFGDQKVIATSDSSEITEAWESLLRELPGARLIVAAGVLVRGSASRVDLLISGSVDQDKVESVVASIEQIVSREITYSVVSYDELYYRLSVRDKFISSILSGKHRIIVDVNHILKDQ